MCIDICSLKVLKQIREERKAGNQVEDYQYQNLIGKAYAIRGL